MIASRVREAPAAPSRQNRSAAAYTVVTAATLRIGTPGTAQTSATKAASEIGRKRRNRYAIGVRLTGHSAPVTSSVAAKTIAPIARPDQNSQLIRIAAHVVVTAQSPGVAPSRATDAQSA